ncbi:hypothetical protein [Candidatus Bathycorpusculum sp.]|jgi:hypothetical protein|uniref:hypothetical protein n=1 Tax=Candidatus Bathycorpusculum sp. TaxID=2994959 RepID=UPI0028349605|nr:hypothetical protein [Candidatus Termitimicrobium sp.]MCL2431296.1 hypothetical protein [Candidatus Termitimicrobium sp.]MDR0471299.1 hypothetical protein [Nitrososphaerota archaeon]
MNFPLAIPDISLWLAVTAIILLITSELLYSSATFSSKIHLDRNLLRILAVGCGFGFMLTVLMRFAGLA